MKLQGKTALVTGAARRIGRHIALKLASAGARILVHARTPSNDAEETLSLIQKANDSELVYHDFSDPDTTGKWFQNLISRFSGVGYPGQFGLFLHSGHPEYYDTA